MNKLLGQKVKCSAYLKKIKDKQRFEKAFDSDGYYIYDTEYLNKYETWYKEANSNGNNMYDYPGFPEADMAEDGEIIVKEYYKEIPEQFEGYIVGERIVPATKKLYYKIESITYDPIAQEEKYHEHIGKELDKDVDCYQVAYRMNGKRYVPKDKIEFEKENKDVIK